MHTPAFQQHFAIGVDLAYGVLLRIKKTHAKESFIRKQIHNKSLTTESVRVKRLKDTATKYGFVTTMNIGG